MKKIDTVILERAQKWLTGSFDKETRDQVQALIDSDPVALTDAFYQDLEFGTGGLRGIMGVGTNRMNQYTVGMATQGLANYLLQCFPSEDQISVAVAHDCRNNSPFFTQVTADILSANGIKVFLFDALRPVPLLSFAVRHFGCQSGIVVTASHNPKEYNGYKVYWDDGGQLVPPHDLNVIAEVKKIKSIDQIKFEGNDELVEVLDEDFDQMYIDTIKNLSMSPDLIARHKDMKIVFTPIHGSAVRLVPAALRAFGFEKVFNVPEQDVVSGDFPTVISPNPEESTALEMALIRAREVGAELVMATDPDADRVGVAVLDHAGNYILLNGNQAASLMIYYLLEQWKQHNKLTGNEFLAKTIVTTELIKNIADHYGVECFDVLTGFKYIAEIIRYYEGEKTFIAGGEESYGYLIGDFVRDKDAIIACCILAETAAWAREKGNTLYGLLDEIYLQFGLYHETLMSITKKGKSGMEEIQAMMQGFRLDTPDRIAGLMVVKVYDYYSRTSLDVLTGQETHLEFPRSNVLQLFLEDETKITMRPSGTEPKIKFYFGTMTKVSSKTDIVSARRNMDSKIERIKRELGLV
jgi:phosphoglucomutase